MQDQGELTLEWLAVTGVVALMLLLPIPLARPAIWLCQRSQGQVCLFQRVLEPRRQTQIFVVEKRTSAFQNVEMLQVLACLDVRTLIVSML